MTEHVKLTSLAVCAYLALGGRVAADPIGFAIEESFDREPRAAAVSTWQPVASDHRLQLRAGIRASSVRDDLLVPLTFSGGGLDLGAGYRGPIGPGTLDVHIELGLALVANRFGHLGLTLDHGVTAGYLFPLHRTRDWRLQLGPAIGESSDSLALESWDDAHGYWLGVLWLGPAARATGPLAGAWRLDGTLELAVLGTVGRPDEFRRNKQDPTTDVTFYAFHTFADPTVFAPWDAQLVRVDLAARRGTWSLGWQGRFAHADAPQTILVFESVLYGARAWGL